MLTHKRLIVIALTVLVLAVVLYALGPAPAPSNGTPADDSSPTATTPTTQSPPSPTTTTTTPKPVVKTVTSKTNSMTVAAHQQPGKTIVIESVSLINPGFIIVQEASGDRDQVVPSKTIATSALIKAGTTKNVSISVTTSPGARYFLTLRTDNSNKTYYPPEDPIALDTADKPISTMITTDAPSTTGPQTVYVNIGNLTFTPKTLTVKKGDTVFFRNIDIFPHTVTSSAFGGRHVVAAGGSYMLNTATLAPGTYSYHCEYHSPMTGTITVQ